MRRRHYRGGLRRAIFMAFGVAIVATGATVAGVHWLLGGGPDFWDQMERVEHFAAGRFEVVWAQDAARSDLARAVATDLGVGVRVTDTLGRTLDRFAWPPSCRFEHDLRIPGRGRVSFCIDAYRGHSRPWVTALAFLLPCAVLWGLAGLWARRMARPIRELTQVAQDLGEGKLERRARLRHGMHGEVGELTRAINEMAARIERQIRAERELLATVSHEMRTPLARIRVLLELGREGVERDVLTEIESEVVEMDSLVGDLLAGARLDFGALTPIDVDVHGLARRAIERASLPQARLEIEGNLETVRADAALVSRALAALLDNARAHGGGKVTLRVVRRGSRVAFEVDDEGPGLPDGDPSRVFEPFVKGERSAGTGLGLAIVRRIAEAHRGRAYAERLEGGTRVGFDLIFWRRMAN